MIAFAVGAPLAGALLSTLLFRLPSPSLRLIRGVLAGIALLLTFAALPHIDPLSALFAGIISILSFLATLYSLSIFPKTEHEDARWSSRPAYFVLLGAFWSSMLVAVTSTTFSGVWIGISATTLATTFLVGFSGGKAALEAAWKYLMLCSFGIAIALIGILLLGRAGMGADIAPNDALAWDALTRHAGRLRPDLSRVALLLMLLGFGTKAGLVPMHSWLPDAHSKAPAPISALLSGLLVSCSLYAIVRTQQVAALVAPGVFDGTLLFVGSLSILVAAILMLAQSDVKRLVVIFDGRTRGVGRHRAGFGNAVGSVRCDLSYRQPRVHQGARVFGRRDRATRSRDDDDRQTPRALERRERQILLERPHRFDGLAALRHLHLRITDRRCCGAGPCLGGARLRACRRPAGVHRAGALGHRYRIRLAGRAAAGKALAGPGVFRRRLRSDRRAVARAGAVLRLCLQEHRRVRGSGALGVYRQTFVESSELDRAVVATCATHEPLGAYAAAHLLHYLFVDAQGVLDLASPRPAPGRPSVSVAGEIPLFDWHEREMRDTRDVAFTGLPNERALFIAATASIPPALTAEGKGVNIIVVGPVHAGIIEPGRFTFSSGGETVLHLDAQLSYSRRGVERFLQGLDAVGAAPRVARVCAACSVARSWAYARALESLAGVVCDERTEWTRLIFAELERLYNHIFDLSRRRQGPDTATARRRALALKERVHRICAEATGHRFAFDAIVPGGVRTIESLRIRMRWRRTSNNCAATSNRLPRRAVPQSFAGQPVRGRGPCFSSATARAFGTVGPARRASGGTIDIRQLRSVWRVPRAPPQCFTANGGDVAARCA